MGYNYQALREVINTGVLFKGDKKDLLEIITQAKPETIIEYLNKWLITKKVHDIYLYNFKEDSFSRFDNSHYINLTKNNKVIGLSKLPLELQKMMTDYYFYKIGDE